MTIHCFRLHLSEVKVLAYADDVAVFRSDMPSVSCVIQRTNNFCEASGVAINKPKTTAFAYGRCDSVLDVFDGIHWGRKPSTYLGSLLQNHVTSTAHCSSVAMKLAETTSK